MLKLLHDEVWAFDAEWVPDVDTGRRVYGLPAEMKDSAVRAHMWRRGGATLEDPQPYLKTALCRVVSVAAVIRQRRREGASSEGDPEGPVHLRLHSLPGADEPEMTERELLSRFLNALGDRKPQVVGYNSQNADFPILLQRALVQRVTAPDFCRRPNKPWEGVDYFARGSDFHVDLRESLGSWGKGTPSLHEIATACGIPGKLDVDGAGVVDLWLDGDLRRIVQYNECDALTTYLLWLRVVRLTGRLSPEEADAEERQLERLLETEGAQPGHEHLLRFLETWRQMRGGTGPGT